MSHTVEFTFTRRFLFDAAKRDQAWRGLILVVAYAVAVSGWTYLRGGLAAFDADYALWLGAGALFLALVWAAATWKIVLKIDALWLVQSPDRRIRYELDDEGISVQLGDSSSRFAWKDLRRVWRYRDAWLLEVVKMNSILFPGHIASREVQDFIVERCRAVGTRI